MKTPSIKMSSGNAIPHIGLGLWRNKDRKACEQSVKDALEIGYRHFDTAQIYGNEAYVGNALKDSGVKREEVFITTKIWNDNLWWEGFDTSLADSLQALQTDYVDLLLIHFPVTTDRRPAWHKMEAAHKNGLAKTIGVSNYTVRHLEELLNECSIKPAVNQVELHVFLQQPELLEFCKKHDIVVEAYSPLAHGHGLDDPVLATIAKKHSKTSAQIMLRWCVEQGLVILPKSTHKERIQENFEVFDFKLDKADQTELKKLDKDLRTCWDPTHVP